MSQPLPRQARRLSRCRRGEARGRHGSKRAATAEKTDSAAEAPATVAPPAKPTQFASAAPTVASVEPIRKEAWLPVLVPIGRRPPQRRLPPIVESSPVKTASATDEDVRPKILPVGRGAPARETRKIVQPRLGKPVGDEGGSPRRFGAPGRAHRFPLQITRKNGVDDDSDVDLHEGAMPAPDDGLCGRDSRGSLRTASEAADSVDTACLSLLWSRC